ncbi:GspH/FimT family pseudopilin [Arsukibacterium sp.]|uniref:GspH/FimT family pseudopilin n=1 Tax=Arsukibacterium sp. TaxID=1977258 RepID=UPI002FDAF1FF
MRVKGLTLLEMLLVVALLALLAQISLPAFADLLHRKRADSYMQQFSRHLSFARIQAASSQQSVILCPRLGTECQPNWENHPIFMLMQDPATDSEHLLRQLPGVSHGHRLAYSRSQVQFRRDGSLDALENGTFYYCPPASFNWHYRLVLNQAGRQRLNFVTERCPF